MNYVTLTSDLQTYMLRTDEPYLAKLPDIIQQGIIRIYNNAKDIGFEIRDNFTLSNNSYVIRKPTNWRETISFSVVNDGLITYLLPRTYEYCTTYQPNLAITGTPKFYYDANNANGTAACSATANIFPPFFPPLFLLLLPPLVIILVEFIDG